MIRLCAICSFDGRGTNLTTEICESCRAKPENDGWGETWEEFGDKADAADSAPAQSYADLLDRNFKVTELETKILNLVLFGIEETYVRRDHRGRRRGTRTRTRYLTARQIAVVIGCDHRYVSFVRSQFDSMVHGLPSKIRKLR